MFYCIIVLTYKVTSFVFIGVQTYYTTKRPCTLFILKKTCKVVISLEKYEQLEKSARNAEYLSIIDQGIAQLEAGKGQAHELFETNDK